MEKENLINSMVANMADKNNKIDLDAYSRGLNDMFQSLQEERDRLRELLERSYHAVKNTTKDRSLKDDLEQFLQSKEYEVGVAKCNSCSGDGWIYHDKSGQSGYIKPCKCSDNRNNR